MVKRNTPAKPGPKPRDDEIDVFGLTHVGKVRKNNQDHFLICQLKRHLEVHLTSIPNIAQVTGGIERLAFLAMVADGVGGGPGGEEASRLALSHITQYVAQSMHCYYASDPANDDAFAAALEAAARKSHAAITSRAAEDEDRRGMATTLTLLIGMWPRAYLLQVGDSRCYFLLDNVLTQISRDQTMAQELFDKGALTRTDAQRTPLKNVLSSSIGGSQNEPVVTRLEQVWGLVALLCSDGLTKHVSDERIKERLLAMTSAKQVCEALVQDALDGGGTDNITVLVGRTTKKPSP
jgi:serine/threonine protein phosphatase PrpC